MNNYFNLVSIFKWWSDFRTDKLYLRLRSNAFQSAKLVTIFFNLSNFCSHVNCPCFAFARFFLWASDQFEGFKWFYLYWVRPRLLPKSWLQCDRIFFSDLSKNRGKIKYFFCSLRCLKEDVFYNGSCNIFLWMIQLVFTHESGVVFYNFSSRNNIFIFEITWFFKDLWWEFFMWKIVLRDLNGFHLVLVSTRHFRKLKLEGTWFFPQWVIKSLDRWR